MSIFSLGYQKKTLKILIEIKQLLLTVGRTYEPEDSLFHVEQMDTEGELNELERNLKDPEKLKHLVRN